VACRDGPCGVPKSVRVVIRYCRDAGSQLSCGRKAHRPAKPKCCSKRTATRHGYAAHRVVRVRRTICDPLAIGVGMPTDAVSAVLQTGAQGGMQATAANTSCHETERTRVHVASEFGACAHEPCLQRVLDSQLGCMRHFVAAQSRAARAANDTISLIAALVRCP
jgi:hypothetical protein